MKGLIEILNSERFDRFGVVDYYDTMTVKIGHSTMEKLRKLDIKNNNMGIEIDFEPTEYKCNCYNEQRYYLFDTLLDNKVAILKIPKTEVIFNEPATVLYKDGKKYVCKCDNEDKFSEELGLALCLLKSFGVSYSDFEELLKGAKRQGVKNGSKD